MTEITFIYLCRLCLRNIAILRFSPQDAVFHSGLFLVSMVHAATQPRSMLLLIIFLLAQTRCSCVNIRIGDNICCFTEVLHILSIISIWIFFTQDIPCSIDICIDEKSPVCFIQSSAHPLPRKSIACRIAFYRQEWNLSLTGLLLMYNFLPGVQQVSLLLQRYTGGYPKTDKTE